MAIAYINTENISVFPSTRRDNKQVSARLISESSVVSMINKLIDTDGYVITPDNDEDIIEDSTMLEFNIHGYYFAIAQTSLLRSKFPSSNNIYANIYLDEVGNYIELQGQDFDNNDVWEYRGVTFSDTDLTLASENPADYSLWLFTRDEQQTWQVPLESRTKFTFDVALGVDGGVI